jgi:hypothetical protein
MNYLNVNIPPFWGFLDTGFLYDLEPSVSRERIVVEVFAYTSIPQRCGLFSVMTEFGSQHARVPIHYLHTNEEGGTFYPLDWIQLWDTMSYYCSVNILDYCKNRAAHVILKNKSLEKVQYMFTLDWCFGPQYTSGYGEMASGHKCGHVFKGDGQYYIQPNNRVLWMDGGSFIAKTFPVKPDWKVFSHEFSCESTGSRWVSESEEELWFYDFKEQS